jgi:hypothetical protein
VADEDKSPTARASFSYGEYWNQVLCQSTVQAEPFSHQDHGPLRDLHLPSQDGVGVVGELRDTQMKPEDETIALKFLLLFLGDIQQEGFGSARWHHQPPLVPRSVSWQCHSGVSGCLTV